jgi:uncharacterized protein (TIGR03083 family)
MGGIMDDTGCVALVDTGRDELRARIGDVRERFSRLARSADPHARRTGLDWTVHQVVAHVLTIANRYRMIAEGQDFHRASCPRDLDRINQDEVDAVMAPIPELMDQLEALAPVMDAMFDSLPDDYSVEFHCGVIVSGIMAQTNWLMELILHGGDIARAVGTPWEVRERDMLLILRGLAEAGPGWLRAEISPAIDVCVAFQIPDARPYVVHVHDGVAEFRERRPGDRPDAVLRSNASTVVQMFLQRIGVVAAARKGAILVGGRRPWKALRFLSYFEPV